MIIMVLHRAVQGLKEFVLINKMSNAKENGVEEQLSHAGLERKREHTCYLFCSNSFEAGFGVQSYSKRERGGGGPNAVKSLTFDF
jgi:hypothetical protein